ncbi:RagB/SusD family nutrient uptake outer membrane protein [Olivibacter sp. SDN3]|uniref:RagB/SusD family nutrient uptake outer membrane protein n=1 Tax=Olivibacter sp. SDN3 TaxID=2764720 RepID=UPI001650F9C1|nr:RagB/SusD family nutrient uptake outer membrane protein [Olivibacter sp. SDN3]QNL49921.1 RagB/SusD family nutrient uptake outer membrane protein [Olivibacter sp. SDN3]
MKTTIISIITAATLFGLSSCSQSFLDEDNKSNLTQENYFQNAAQAETFVTGIYTSLRANTAGNGYGETPWVTLELLTGHATTNSQSNFNLGVINHTAGTENPGFYSYWSEFYNGIAKANVAITRIPEIEMDEAQKANLLGEAHFLRAYYYFFLTRLFGNIPLLTAPVDPANVEELRPNRSEVQAIYDLIVSDLTIAEGSGLPNVDRTGKVSLGAVKALLSNVYLTMAGYPLNRGAEYYQLAADKAAELANEGDGWYPLFDNLNALHDRPNKNQGEFIFQVQYLGGVANNNVTQMIIPYNIGISRHGDEYGSINPLPAFVNTYEEGDLRSAERGFFFTRAQRLSTSATVTFPPALFKYWLEASSGANGDLNPDINFTLMRMPEVYLIHAEAANEANGGPTPEAYASLNKVRDRANLAPLSGLTQDQFRQAVWRERYHELCYENKSYFDILRTRKAYNLSNDTFVDLIGFRNESGTTWTEKYLLLPIPQRELQANPNLEPNNPGW